MRRYLVTVAALIVVAAGLDASASGVGAKRPDPPGRPLVRKNVVELTEEERKAFVDAVLRLKATPSPYDETLNYYDQFVEWHLSLYRCTGLDFGPTVGHGGPFFLPWHRVFVRLFEKALGDVAGRPIAVPYWDWTDPESATTVFAEDFMGGDGDPTAGHAVTSGPFAKDRWRVALAPESQPFAASYRPYLVRRFGGGDSPAPGDAPLFPLPPVADVQWALSAPAYDTAPFDMRSDPNRSFRNALEGWWRALPDGTRYADPVDHQHCGPDGTALGTRDGGNAHNRVHTWVGGVADDAATATLFGTMLMPNSPADPVFFLHHANIDRLFAKWQDLHPDARFAPDGLAKTPIEPFVDGPGRFTPASTWDIDDLGYVYADHPDSDDVPVPAPDPAPPSSQAPTFPVAEASLAVSYGCSVVT